MKSYEGINKKNKVLSVVIEVAALRYCRNSVDCVQDDYISDGRV